MPDTSGSIAPNEDDKGNTNKSVRGSLSRIGVWEGETPDGHVFERWTGDMVTHDGKILFVAAPWGDLLRSQDGGESWEPIAHEELSGKVTFTQPQKKIILYDFDSIMEYLEENSKKRF